MRQSDEDQPPFRSHRCHRRWIVSASARRRSRRARPPFTARPRSSVTGFYRTPAFHIAQRRGLFAKEGLDVEFLLVRLAPDHNEGLAQGRWPLTMSSADTMLARTTQDGVDFVLFLEAEEGLDVQLIAQPKYKSLQELRGKLFAADPVDSNYDLVRNKIMRDNGIPESEYRYEVIGNSSMRAHRLHRRQGRRGDAAAAVLRPRDRQGRRAACARAPTTSRTGRSAAAGACANGWKRTARSSSASRARWRPPTDWLLLPENKEEMLQILMKEEKLTRAWAESNYSYVVPKCMLRPESIRKNLELRIELGYYKPPHKPTEAFYDMSYWTEATGLAGAAAGRAAAQRGGGVRGAPWLASSRSRGARR